MSTVVDQGDAIRGILDRYPDAGRESLIPLLQDVQEAQGFLSREAVVRIGKHLKLPASKIYGVSTFYNQFRFAPLGKFHIQLCRGTACHVKNSSKVLAAIEQELEIKAGETTRDGRFSIEVLTCIGACGLAPVISINGTFYAGVTPQKVRKIIAEYRKKGDKDVSA